jgi:hypothetical protein
MMQTRPKKYARHKMLPHIFFPEGIAVLHYLSSAMGAPSTFTQGTIIQYGGLTPFRNMYGESTSDAVGLAYLRCGRFSQKVEVRYREV